MNQNNACPAADPASWENITSTGRAQVQTFFIKKISKRGFFYE